MCLFSQAIGAPRPCSHPYVGVSLPRGTPGSGAKDELEWGLPQSILWDEVDGAAAINLRWRLAPAPSLTGGVPVVDRQGVPVRIAEDRLLADPAVDRLRDELDAS
jgi:hypothetical protein